MVVSLQRERQNFRWNPNSNELDKICTSRQKLQQSLPLCSSGGSNLHRKLPHSALFQILLLPADHVGLEGQDSLLALAQALLERAHGHPWRLGLPLRWGERVLEQKYKSEFVAFAFWFPCVWIFTCCALRLLSSCSSRVLSFISRLSLFSQVDCSWASALWSRSTFSTYALFLLSSSSSWRPRPRAASKASSSRLALVLCSSAVVRNRSSSRSTRSRSKFCSSSETKKKKREHD